MRRGDARSSPGGGLDLAVALRMLLVMLHLNLAVAAATAADPTDAPRPGLREIAAAYGFSERDVETVLEGKPAFGKLQTVSKNELALSALMLTRRDVDWHLGRLAKFESSDPTLRGIGELEGDGVASLAKLELTTEEIDRIAEAEAGDDFNFSTAELDALTVAVAGASGEAGRRMATLDSFRSILAARYVAYRDKGLAGIVAYDRGDGEESSPVESLERAFGELRVTSQIAPRVAGVMENYPAAPVKGVSSEFLWARNDAEGRSLVSLSHRVFGRDGRHAIAIERRFYVHHTLNSMQAVAVAIAVEEGTVVLYSNRTTTDLVTGFGSAIAKKIGTVLMRQEVEKLTEAFLDIAE